MFVRLHTPALLSVCEGKPLLQVPDQRILILKNSNERKSILKMCLAAEGHRLELQIPDRPGEKIRSIRI